jgi:hypothetical protein
MMKMSVKYLICVCILVLGGYKQLSACNKSNKFNTSLGQATLVRPATSKKNSKVSVIASADSDSKNTHCNIDIAETEVEELVVSKKCMEVANTTSIFLARAPLYSSGNKMYSFLCKNSHTAFYQYLLLQVFRI